MQEGRYFKREEFVCKCGCNSCEMDLDFMVLIIRARAEASIPFVITSGYRCAEHNRNEGGVSNSAHTKGKAVDIAAPTPYHRFHIIKGLIVAGFTRIGINEQRGFIHVDNDEDKPQETIFLYPRS